MKTKTVEFKATTTVRGQRSTLVRVALVSDGIAIERLDTDYVLCLNTIEEARTTDEPSETDRWREHQD